MQIISSKKWNLLQGQLKALQSSTLLAQISNFNTQIFPHWKIFQEVAAYTTIDDMYSVISRLATEAALIPFKAYDKDGEELPPTDNLNKIIETLTFEQKEIMYTYLWALAECFMYKVKLPYGPNAGMQKIKFLHPGRMVVVLSETFPVEIVGYRYYDSIRGVQFDILPEDMVYIHLFNPTLDSLEEWRGLSAAKVLTKRLTRIDSNLSISTAMMQNGGIKKVMYSKMPGIEIGAWDQFKDNYAKFSNNKSNAGAPYLSGYPDLGVLDIGSTGSEMELAALAEVDFKKICNALSVSDVLFNSDKGAKYDNTGNFLKAMYNSAIRPMVKRVEDAMNAGVVPDLKTNGKIKADYSGIAVLQENQKEKADAWAAQPAIVINEMRVAMGQDELADEMAGRLLVKTGYQLADDLNIDVQPIANTANDYGK